MEQVLFRLGQMEDKLLVLKDKYGVNVCGEGGEYETFTLDCPLFRQVLEYFQNNLNMEYIVLFKIHLFSRK